MAKVKVTNISLQVLNILIKETKDNKNVQLLPKQDLIIDKTLLTEQVRRLRDLGHLSILPYTETVEL